MTTRKDQTGRAGPPEPPLSCNRTADLRLAAAVGACPRALPADARTALPRIEIKICGLTSPDAARACVAAGAHAIGMVFHPASPRNLQPAQAQAIAGQLPPTVAKVGVFVDQPAAEVLRIAAQVGLSAVQLHQTPTGQNYEIFIRNNLHVVQVLRSTGPELLAQVRALPPQVGLLVECGCGPLPGGNGTVWNWAEARALREIRPFAIAGGLDLENVAQALAASGASAVDVSSGVEATPGVKDLNKVKAFIAAVRAAAGNRQSCVFNRAAATERRPPV